MASDLVRLHISPFDQNIFERIIPASIRATCSPASFHTVKTFPERPFGFLELPQSAAEGLKKKLNGTTLRGAKVRIEEARLVKRRKSESLDIEEAFVQSKRPKIQEKPRSNKTDVVIKGYELPVDRLVKRGWTDDKTKKRSITKEDNLQDRKALFKTMLPSNAMPIVDKSKKTKAKRSDKRLKKGEVIVEEFGHNRSTFAISSANTAVRKPAVSYEDGIGWLDEHGEVVEAETAQRRRHIAGGVRNSAVQKLESITVEDRTADANDSSDEEGSGVDKESVQPQREASNIDASDETSDSDTTSDETSDSDTTSDENSGMDNDHDSQHKSDASDSESDSAESAPSQGDISMNEIEVHPLEALYKRPKDSEKAEKLAPINTSFSFFDAQEDDVQMEGTSTILPQTPHTKQDLEWRHQRSAAPTPDTAAIDGRFGFPFRSSDDEDSDREATPIQQTSSRRHEETPATQESAFRKFFYETRGDTDRAWKKRRRDAKKLQRQRENRRLSRRIV